MLKPVDGGPLNPGMEASAAPEGSVFTSSSVPAAEPEKK